MFCNFVMTFQPCCLLLMTAILSFHASVSEEQRARTVLNLMISLSLNEYVDTDNFNCEKWPPKLALYWTNWEPVWFWQNTVGPVECVTNAHGFCEYTCVQSCVNNQRAKLYSSLYIQGKVWGCTNTRNFTERRNPERGRGDNKLSMPHSDVALLSLSL